MVARSPNERLTLLVGNPMLSRIVFSSLSGTICRISRSTCANTRSVCSTRVPCGARTCMRIWPERSEEHTSELQSHLNLVCRLLLEKKKQIIQTSYDARKNKKKRKKQ